MEETALGAEEADGERRGRKDEAAKWERRRGEKEAKEGEGERNEDGGGAASSQKVGGGLQSAKDADICNGGADEGAIAATAAACVDTPYLTQMWGGAHTRGLVGVVTMAKSPPIPQRGLLGGLEYAAAFWGEAQNSQWPGLHRI